MPSASEFLTDLWRASLGHDLAGARQQLDRSATSLGLGGSIDAVLLPVMRRLGQGWSEGHIDVDTERLITEVSRAWLEHRILSAPKPRVGAPLVLACAPGEQHSIGLEALNALLREQGQPCRRLGARTSTRALTTSIVANRPTGVVVVSLRRETRVGAVTSLLAAADLGVPVFYAGGAFASAQLRHDVPGVYLGTSLERASRLLVDACR